MVKGSKKKVIIVLMMSLFIIALLMGKYYYANHETRYIEVQKVEYKDINRLISVSGEVMSSSYEYVYSDLKLRINKVYVKVGDEVKKGDLICRYETKELEEKIALFTDEIQKMKKMNTLYKKRIEEQKEYIIEQKKIGKKAIVQQLNNKVNQYNYDVKLKQSLNKSISNCNEDMKNCIIMKQYEKLVDKKKNYLTLLVKLDRKIEELQEQIKSLKKQYNTILKEQTSTSFEEGNLLGKTKALESSIKKLKKQRNKLKRKREKSVILAPQDGIITEVYVKEGVYNNIGKAALIHINGKVAIRAYISGNDIISVKEGMNVKVIKGMDQFKGYAGSIKNVSHAVTEEGYEIEIFSSDMRNAIVGENVALQIILSEVKDVLAVPYDGMFRQEGQDYVYVLEKIEHNQYKLKKRIIKKGLEGSYYVEILSGDVKYGDYIVDNPEQHFENEIVYVRK